MTSPADLEDLEVLRDSGTAHWQPARQFTDRARPGEFEACAGSPVCEVIEAIAARLNDLHDLVAGIDCVGGTTHLVGGHPVIFPGYDFAQAFLDEISLPRAKQDRNTKDPVLRKGLGDDLARQLRSPVNRDGVSLVGLDVGPGALAIEDGIRRNVDDRGSNRA